ncbi:hypothetical protein CKO13_04280 [Halorhodospira neutriphila]|uniref:Uncharacterized protein n=1 Tax=Halorhodospira neutriphila TaxID=168379 RepID=A0ABS1E615_9GAMM|nr:hypothetical protein [Halorhodospira neutriphila]
MKIQLVTLRYHPEVLDNDNLPLVWIERLDALSRTLRQLLLSESPPLRLVATSLLHDPNRIQPGLLGHVLIEVVLLAIAFLVEFGGVSVRDACIVQGTILLIQEPSEIANISVFPKDQILFI